MRRFTAIADEIEGAQHTKRYVMNIAVDHLVGTSIRNYRITHLLGQGSLSVVYLAEEQRQRFPVMLTLFTLSQAYSNQAREFFFTRFAQIANGLRLLNHPAILSTLDFGEYSGHPFLVTPYVEEASLASVLKQQKRFSPAQTLPLLQQIVAGLDHAHELGTVHGSLRSGNILLGTRQNVHITGFGLAQMLAWRGLSKNNHPLLNIGGTFLYSPEYVAPEVVEGAALTARVDVYALGVLAFEMLTGRTPFSGSDPFAVANQHLTQRVPSLLEFAADLPMGLDLVIQRAMERDPSVRYQSAGKFADSFARVLGVLEAATRPLTVDPSHRDLAGTTMPPHSDWAYSEPGIDAAPSTPPLPPETLRSASAMAGQTRLHRPSKKMSRRAAIIATAGVIGAGALLGAGANLLGWFQTHTGK
jgi:serine/threonine-protein kinase